MSTAAGSAANGLAHLFGDEPGNVPLHALVVHPSGIGIEIMHQGDQFERELGPWITGFHFHLHKVRDSQFVAFDLQGVVFAHLRLSQHGEQLASMSLQGRADAYLQLAFVVHIHQGAAFAVLVEAEPTYGRSFGPLGAAQEDFAVDFVGEQRVH